MSAGTELHAAGVQRMLDDIQNEVRYTRDYIDLEALEPRVLAALAAVPRHQFVPAALQEQAYTNGPLPIGHGQTISQPYMVALMTHLLQVGEADVVLEIGTGSGYQAAVLSRLVRRVYTVEVVEPLWREACRRFEALGYANIESRFGDGYLGWPEHAPYDGIIVTAAASHIPPALIEQLKPGARLVIPVGLPYSSQDLMVVEKDAAGEVRERVVLPVAFVPLTRPEPI